MTKSSISLLSILILIVPLYAGNISIGIKGGVSIHELHCIYPTLNMDFNFRIGPTLSLIGQINSNENISHQIWIGYYQAGGVHKVPEVDELGRTIAYGKEIVKLDYMDISYGLKLKYYIQNIIPFVLIGTQFDYLINCDNYHIASNNTLFTVAQFKYSELSKINITPFVGIGLGYHFNKYEIYLEYLPNYHLLPFYKYTTPSNFNCKCTAFGHVINSGIIFEL
jgi:hypothetical protein